MANWRPTEITRGGVRSLRFAPIDVGRWFIWGFTALLFLVLPFVFTSGFSITLLSQMGIMIVFALSYNMLLGQAGMLSFGHAVYAGLGAFFAIHAINWIGAGKRHTTTLPPRHPSPLPALPPHLARGICIHPFNVIQFQHFFFLF